MNRKSFSGRGYGTPFLRKGGGEEIGINANWLAERQETCLLLLLQPKPKQFRYQLERINSFFNESFASFSVACSRL